MSFLPRPPVIPVKDRTSVAFVERGQIDVIDGAFVILDKNGIRTQLPIGGIACLMLEPGTRISHAAVELAAEVGCLLVWVGEGGVRVYSAGLPGGARADRLLAQARAALDPKLRLRVVRAMYAVRFGEVPPENRSVDQLRGLEGQRVRQAYEDAAATYGVVWKGRNYDRSAWSESDVPNQCLSAATSCLYGVTEAALLAAGYSPAIGFVHTGKPRSFVYDIADLFKFETVVPIAFQLAATHPADPARAVRIMCRDAFRQSKILDQIIPVTNRLLEDPGGRPFVEPSGVVGAAFPEEARFE